MADEKSLELATFNDIVAELNRRRVEFIFVYAESDGDDSNGFRTAIQIGDTARMVGALELAKQDIMRRCENCDNCEGCDEDAESDDMS